VYICKQVICHTHELARSLSLSLSLSLVSESHSLYHKASVRSCWKRLNLWFAKTTQSSFPRVLHLSLYSTIPLWTRTHINTRTWVYIWVYVCVCVCVYVYIYICTWVCSVSCTSHWLCCTVLQFVAVCCCSELQCVVLVTVRHHPSASMHTNTHTHTHTLI